MSQKDPNEEYRKSYESMHKKTQDGKLLPGHPNYNKPGYDQYGNYHGSGSAQGCFPPGTIVWTPQGNRRIQDILAGDLVWSRSKSGVLEAKRVLRAKTHNPQRLWKITLDGVRTLRTTAIHSFRADEKWVQARHLRLGQTIFGVDQSGCITTYKVRESCPDAVFSEVFNLVVEDNFNFFAGQSLVHTFTHLRTLRVLACRVFLRHIGCRPAVVGRELLASSSP